MSRSHRHEFPVRLLQCTAEVITGVIADYCLRKPPFHSPDLFAAHLGSIAPITYHQSRGDGTSRLFFGATWAASSCAAHPDIRVPASAATRFLTQRLGASSGLRASAQNSLPPRCCPATSSCAQPPQRTSTTPSRRAQCRRGLVRPQHPHTRRAGKRCSTMRKVRSSLPGMGMVAGLAML